MTAQALVIRARWMNESERYQPTEVLRAFQTGAEILTMCGDFFLSIQTTDSFQVGERSFPPWSFPR